MNSNIRILFFLLVGIKVSAQISVTLDEAYSKAIVNNLDVRGAELRVNFQDRLKNSAVILDPLNISSDIGQIDSKDMDYEFSVSQTFRLPSFYKRQKQVLREEWQNSLVSVNLQKWQIKKELGLIFNNLNYLDKKKYLLEKMDSIYTQYFNRAELRFKKGETNLLEKATAENLKSQINIQLFNIKKDKEIVLQQLNLLVNGKEYYTNKKEDFFVEKINFSENDINNHWIIRQLEQQKNIEQARLGVEKSKLQPYFSLGYNNIAKRETGELMRLHNISVGFNIPIFNSGQKAIMEGQKVNQLIAENNKHIGVRELKKQFVELNGNYEKLKSQVDYYQQKGLKNSEEIIKTANYQFYRGEINFLDWSILVNQALDIQNVYIDKVKELNDKTIELNSLFIN